MDVDVPMVLVLDESKTTGSLERKYDGHKARRHCSGIFVHLA